ncbi:MAG: hypothetical protein IKN55_10655 [Oscillospiraceae bacterium]|nr:hypothetical protein [Oscillospiraceae bacterium]
MKQIIPEEASLLAICKQHDIVFAKAVDIDSHKKSFIVLEQSIDDFLSFLKSINFTVLLYTYYFHDVNDYLISEVSLTTDDYDLTTLNLEDIKQKICDYNTKLKNDSRFKDPYLLVLCGMMEYGRCFCIEITDDWMKSIDESGETVYAYEEPSDALHLLVYPSEEDYLKHEDEQLALAIEKEEKLKKEIFEFLVRDPKFRICTNASLRSQYATSFVVYQPTIVQRILELYPNNWRRKIHYFVESVWRLYKAGETKYNDGIKNIL